MVRSVSGQIILPLGKTNRIRIDQSETQQKLYSAVLRACKAVQGTEIMFQEKNKWDQVNIWRSTVKYFEEKFY